MCYLPNCRQSSPKIVRTIVAAQKIWKRKAGQTQRAAPAWGDSHDWTKAPAKAKVWTKTDFTKHQKPPKPTKNGTCRANTVGYGLTTVENTTRRLWEWNTGRALGDWRDDKVFAAWFAKQEQKIAA